MIRAACQRFGIERVDVAGLSSGHALFKPEAALPEYDVVFAKARCALEAMAVGCAVIVADFPGLGGMVATENLRELRRLNFGVRTMQSATITEENIYAQLICYNASGARKISEWIRHDTDIEKAIDKLENYYNEAFSEAKPRMGSPIHTWSSAASDYLFTLASVIKTRALAEQRAAQTDWLYGEVQRLTEQNAQLQSQLTVTQIELATIRASRTWKAFSGYRKLRKWLR
ncbi:MAG: hypothetical protein Q7T96_05715 [Methylobacter sp.]|nr:hypothetical protein [Methylobacter sp.]